MRDAFACVCTPHVAYSRSDLVCWSAQPLAFCPRWERTAIVCCCGLALLFSYPTLRSQQKYTNMGNVSMNTLFALLCPNQWECDEYMHTTYIHIIWAPNMYNTKIYIQIFKSISWSLSLYKTSVCFTWLSVGVTEVERKTLQYTLDHMKYTPKAQILKI